MFSKTTKSTDDPKKDGNFFSNLSPAGRVGVGCLVILFGLPFLCGQLTTWALNDGTEEGAAIGQVAGGSIVGTGILLVLVVVGLLLIAGVKVDREYERSVVFRLGKFLTIRGPGTYLLLPLIDTREKVDLRVNVVDIPPQDTVTRDNVTLNVDAVLYYRIEDPEKATIVVDKYQHATTQAALTTLRDVIGRHLLDEVLQDRGKLNVRLTERVDEITDPWGIIVEAVEIKDVGIPENLQRAMAKEAEALREKRSRLIKAEAEEEATEKLANASQKLASNPMALELRRMQMIAEIGTEQNTTTILMVPSEILSFAEHVNRFIEKQHLKEN